MVWNYTYYFFDNTMKKHNLTFDNYDDELIMYCAHIEGLKRNMIIEHKKILFNLHQKKMVLLV
jgi:hypothetical protein